MKRISWLSNLSMNARFLSKYMDFDCKIIMDSKLDDVQLNEDFQCLN